MTRERSTRARGAARVGDDETRRVIVVGLAGGTGRDQASDLKRELHDALESGTGLVVLDLSQVSDLDSRILGVVVSAVRGRWAPTLRIVCADRTRHILALLDVDARASFCSSLDRAVRGEAG
jgi:anti-anti-sigma regulatory factor